MYYIYNWSIVDRYLKLSKLLTMNDDTI